MRLRSNSLESAAPAGSCRSPGTMTAHAAITDLLSLRGAVGNRAFTRVARRVLARHPMQDAIDAMDRANAPSEQEIAATRLGRTAAQLDRFARQFSGPNLTSVLAAYHDMTDDDESYA
jgi:hypothetical protein